MKLFFIILTLIIFNGCSFDNKTGIWLNEKDNLDKKEVNIKDNKFKSFNQKENNSLQEISPENNLQLSTNPPKKNLKWTDVYYNFNNSFDNFSYSNQNNLKIKSGKISRYDLSSKFLFKDNKFFLTDIKGNLIIYSMTQDSILKFNFYKKKYKKIKKKLDTIIQNDLIYISDNLGYIYSYDYKKNSLNWAKYYKIPFRSNLKIYQDKLVVSDQNNNLYFFDKFNGNLIKLIPTEETIVKKNFRNNISINENSLLYLNTYGSLYSINNESLKINWFLNLNKSLDLGPSNLFSGNEIVNYEDKIYVSSNESTYIIENNTGNIISKKNFSSDIKPIINNNFYFSVTKNGFLLAMDGLNGKLIYSIDLNKNFFNSFKEDVKPNNIFIVNSKLYIFLNNSYLLKFDINGNFLNKVKLPSKINSDPIFLNNTLYF